MKAWGGRFSGAPDEVSSEFGRSIEVDAELALDDIAGSIAHVHGLERAGIVTPTEAEGLVAGLRTAMVLTGSRDLDALRRVPVVTGSKLTAWVKAEEAHE